MAKKPIESQITELPKDCGYRLLKPIPVVITKDGDGKRAIAKNVGLLVDGIGTTPDEARDDLRDLILDQFEHYKKHKDNYVGYGQLIGKRLEEYIAPIQKSTN